MELIQFIVLNHSPVMRTIPELVSHSLNFHTPPKKGNATRKNVIYMFLGHLITNMDQWKLGVIGNDHVQAR
ncbi:hypothetical protein TNCV_2400791 [Trichonephila clavipes]|nr:hypothetical protein TNCV_2400791 [Trichonephila clavipes]